MNRASIPLRALFSIVTCMMLASTSANAADSYLTGVTITRMRAVGDYQGTTFDYTFEIWLSTPPSYTSGSGCTSTYRVFVDAKNKHIYATALLALATGRKLNINVDDTLPIRGGACEVSFLDIEP